MMVDIAAFVAIPIGNIAMTIGFLKLIWISDGALAYAGGGRATRNLPGLAWVAAGAALCFLPLALRYPG
ncbi:hypothetical protein ASE73_12165 [Sphingomonas sp. Leaf24]|uniref:hypothetical protein n=1 Tax=unclassified Sphingomonas TaxID=196159 RepID=UPI0006F501BB|nr:MULTISPECIES: hypothetical protein [unclassified Sphingomonas]KQM13202.1 hypothetical protein ASE50_10215 [Sphingomonas sp. Leaf5]KQM85789.1 hypothetical protein ASE73_12165 [Sphingomonas sp. Leaf24]